MKNLEIARIFYEIADILEVQGVEFKPRAYRRAARSIEELSEDIAAVRKRGELRGIPGVGEHIEKKIIEILDTGKLKYYEKLKKEIPVDLESLSRVEGLGPKKAMALYKKLGVRNLKDLEKAVKAGKVKGLPGFGRKSEEKMAASVGEAKKSASRLMISKAMPIVAELEGKLSKVAGVRKLETVGSFRRRLPTVGDLDILVVSSKPKEVMGAFAKIEKGTKVLAKGPSKSSIKLPSGLQVDLRVFDEPSYGAAMMYFTGSKDHNVALRKIAMKKKWKLSEYGLFSGEKRLAGKTEQEVYKKLGMQWVPPELRENMGEIEAAQKGKLPRLVEEKQIRGDLHTHTEWSEGKNTLEEMAAAGKALGYEYMLISDHGGTLPKIANPLNEKRLRKQMAAIDRLNKKLRGIKLLKGTETNILEDGSIDLPNSVLKDLDIVIASVHTKFKMSPRAMTKRILAAAENEHVDVIGHPTGRLLGSRKAFQYDLPSVADACKKSHTALEINCYPERLDLDYANVKNARGKAKFTLGTDAHEKGSMKFMGLGVSQARKGWCTKKDILNTLALKDLRKFFKS